MQFKKITRVDAQEKGLHYFFTGRECKWGHCAPRFTSIGAYYAWKVLGMRYATAGLCYKCCQLMEVKGGMIGNTFEQIMEDWNPYTEDESIKLLPLLSGTKNMGYKVVGTTKVDTNMYNELSMIMWITDHNKYVKASMSKENKSRITKDHICYSEKKYINMHRVVLNIHNEGQGVVGDHINGDKRDNRLVNLREASITDNKRNSRIMKNNKTGFIGVDIIQNTSDKIYRARFYRDGKTHFRKCFSCPQEAAKYYDDYLRDLFPSEFNVYNFPKVGERGKDGNIKL